MTNGTWQLTAALSDHKSNIYHRQIGLAISGKGRVVVVGDEGANNLAYHMGYYIGEGCLKYHGSGARSTPLHVRYNGTLCDVSSLLCRLCVRFPPRQPDWGLEQLHSGGPRLRHPIWRRVWKVGDHTRTCGLMLATRVQLFPLRIQSCRRRPMRSSVTYHTEPWRSPPMVPRSP